jgi:Cys-rich protein (TIGR01571 family)
MALTYSHALCGCCSDVSVCLYGAFCLPCLTASTWARLRSEECTPCHCPCPTHPSWVRQFVKRKYGMEANYLGDCVIYTCCFPCANCQDAREVRVRS